jgi:hypothetical protein
MRLSGIDATFLVGHRVAVEPARHDLVGRRLGQHVSRDLLDGEAIERHVVVERLDHPVAVLPHHARQVLLEAVRIRVPREVQPGAGPALAVMRRGEQPVDEARICGILPVARGFGGYRVHFFRRRGQTDQVERHAADQRVQRRLG